MSGIQGNIDAAGTTAQIRKEMETLLLALGEQIVGQIELRAPVGANAHLRGSFGYGLVPYENGVSVAFGTPLDYGNYVEFGTKPHWAPLQPLIRWVEQKLQPHILAIGVDFSTGSARPTGKATKQLRGDARQREILRIARAVQVKIARKGTDAQRFVASALSAMGLEYQVVEDGTGYTYQVNAVPFLNERLPEILQRIKMV